MPSIHDEYHIKIVRRDFQGQTKDDFHATVKRLVDGQTLIFISDWRWVLKLRLSKWNLRRAFKLAAKRERKLSKVEEYCK